MKLLIFLFPYLLAAEPTEPANISKADWIVINVNLVLGTISDKDKPMCSFLDSDVYCMGFPKNKARSKVIKDLVTKDFKKLVKQQGVEGKIQLNFVD